MVIRITGNDSDYHEKPPYYFNQFIANIKQEAHQEMR